MTDISAAELAAQTLAMIDGPLALRIDVPWPPPLCWPNGRTLNHRAKAGQVKKLRGWAQMATWEAMNRQGKFWSDSQSIPVHIIVHAKAKGKLPDKDNCISAVKAALDGIAERIGVNDRWFAAPTVEFATPRDDRFVIIIGDRA